MPRTDGFPTNRELQVEFTADARDVFVAAAERSLESKVGLYPALEDKPLDHFYLRFTRSNPLTEESAQAVHGEELVIAPINKDSIDIIRNSTHSFTGVNELFRDAGEGVIEHYESVAKIIGETVISDSLRFGRIPMNGVSADWSAWLTADRSRSRHASTFKERASKQSLISAKFFVEEASAYVQSDDFDKPLPVKGLEHVMGRRATDPRFDMKHGFNLRISPALPLNGHETPSFIKAYHARMKYFFDKSSQTHERMIDLRAPQSIIDTAAERIAIYRLAMNRAQLFLDT